jgi:hypothetical protein
LREIYNTQHQVTTTCTEIVDSFNDHFANIGKKLAEAFPNEELEYRRYLKNRVNDEMEENFITREEIIKAINELNLDKAIGCDQIPARLVKISAVQIASPLQHIANLCLSTGIYPTKLKMAKVIPVFKANDPLDPNNYRPISLLSVFNKIIEVILSNRLRKHFESKNLLSQNQFGFRKMRSTNTALASIVPLIQNALDNKHKSLGIFLDLTKAFDTVNHKILINKLEHYGVRGNMLQLLKSYLSDRKQRVWINNQHSSERTIEVGVPQGSVLGPLLFLIYINDIEVAVNKGKIRLFADDAGSFYFNNNLERMFNDAQIDLDNINKWLIANKLTINVAKTNYVIFSSIKVYTELQLRIGNKIIQRCEYAKYLGVFLDEHLKWNIHISKLCNKIKPILLWLWRIRYCMTKTSIRLAYISLIQSHLLYNIEYWGATYDNHLDPLVKLQKSAIRCCSFASYRSHTEPLFRNLRVLPLRKLYATTIACFVYKELHSLSHTNIGFARINENIPMRSANRRRYIILRINTNV